MGLKKIIVGNHLIVETREQQEEVIWEKWEKRDPKKVVRDGIINEDMWEKCMWEKSPVKVLFLLKEPTECNDSDLRKYFQKNPVPKARIVQNIARWSYGISHGFPAFSDIESNNVETNKAKLKEGLQSCAWVNLKKTPGGSRADMKEIKDVVNRMCEALTKQILIIGPTHIICCGTGDLFKKCIAGNGWKWDNKDYFGKFKNTKVVLMKHPSSWQKDYMMYYALKGILSAASEYWVDTENGSH